MTKPFKVLSKSTVRPQVSLNTIESSPDDPTPGNLDNIKAMAIHDVKMIFQKFSEVKVCSFGHFDV